MNVLTAPGKRLFLTGDEAVARAALELGVHVVTGYPGNPSTKAITALLPLARQYGMQIEWSVNEKVALEVATGAAWAGKRSLVTMKMSGINVMADSLLSIAHSGVTGAMVIYAVDDVGTYYGMVEQDSRYYARMATLPLLMPASPEEAYRMTHLAFTVSQQTGAPVLLLSTTAVANAITAMKVGKIERPVHEQPATFTRNLPKFTKAVPQWCRDQHADALQRLQQAGELFAQSSNINVISAPQTEAGERPRSGIIVAGVSSTYLEELRLTDPQRFSQLAICKLGSINPFPAAQVRSFLQQVERVLVLEELEPLIETEVLALIAEMGLQISVQGKRNGLLPRVGDYSVDLVRQALDTFMGADQDGIPRAMASIAPTLGLNESRGVSLLRPDSSTSSPLPVSHPSSTLSTLPVSPSATPSAVEAPPRSLEFCPGCPHRMTYYALNQAIERLGFSHDEVITTGDIGCTIIGMNAPLESCWTEVSMGASIGIAQGFKYAGIEQPVLAAMGDGTFYHNGIAGLLNAVQSGVNLTLIILDNSRSAMTGMQPDAGTGRRASGEKAVRASIPMIVRGCGVTDVQVLNPYHLEEITQALEGAMQRPGVSVIIAEAACTTPGVLISREPVYIDQEACLAGRVCEDTPCYHKVGCPSVLLSLDDVQPRLSIDAATCVSCGLCAQACPFDAIKPVSVQDNEHTESTYQEIL